MQKELQKKVMYPTGMGVLFLEQGVVGGWLFFDFIFTVSNCTE